MSAFAQPADAVVFVLRFDARCHFIDPEPLGYPSRSPLVVAGEHDDFQTQLVELFDRAVRRFLNRIGNGDEPGRAIVKRDEDDAAPFFLQGGGVPFAQRPARFGRAEIAVCRRERDGRSLARARLLQ